MKQSPVATPIAIPNLSVTAAAWLLLHPTNRLDRTQLRLRKQLCLANDEVNRAFALAQSFSAMVRNHLVEKLDPWMTEASQCQIKAFVNFAASLRRDYDAVKAALTYQWSNGQDEGQVNRLILLKRMMYGRGKLDLLRRRVMGAPSSGELWVHTNCGRTLRAQIDRGGIYRARLSLGRLKIFRHKSRQPDNRLVQPGVHNLPPGRHFGLVIAGELNVIAVVELVHCYCVAGL
jgi:hypothetical protein